MLAVELMYRDLETSVMLVGASASYLMLLGRGVTKCVRTSCDNRCDNSLGGLIEQVRYRVDNIRDIVLVTFFFFLLFAMKITISLTNAAHIRLAFLFLRVRFSCLFFVCPNTSCHTLFLDVTIVLRNERLSPRIMKVAAVRLFDLNGIGQYLLCTVFAIHKTCLHRKRLSY